MPGQLIHLLLHVIIIVISNVEILRNDLFILGIIIYSFVRKFFKIITYLTKINALNFKHDKRNVFLLSQENLLDIF